MTIQNILPRLRPVFVFCLSLLLLACTSDDSTNSDSGQVPKTIDAAENAYFQFDLATSSQLFEGIFEDSAQDLDTRASAGRQFARIVAFIHQDYDKSRDLLSATEALDVDKFHTVLALARIEIEDAQYAASMAASARAATLADTPVEQYGADIAYADAALSQAVAQILDQRSDELNTRLLRNALDRAHKVMQQQRGQMQTSLVTLELALILGDGPIALEAWRSYFHIGPDLSTSSVLQQPAQTLTHILPNWNKQLLNDEDKEGVVLALANSRMYRAASILALVISDNDPIQSPALGEIVAYYRYLSDIGDITQAFYRKSAVGTGDDKKYKADLEKRSILLWSQLNWSQGAPEFSHKQFESEIGRRFGAEIEFKRISGFLGLHMGHRVVDEDYHVEQYDKSADLRFVSLDFMVSNGFTSWFWDGRAEVGGWAENPLIIQVRSAYADHGLRAWQEINDPKLLEKARQEIAEHESADIDLARKNPHAYLPGLDRRMRHNAYQRLIDELRKSGLEGSDLQMAFVSAIERTDLESSIIAHEGRHAIDARDFTNFMRRPAVREYRAKLSEVAFSSAPALAIGGGILLKNIGDESAHGEANERVMKGLVKWMDNNQEYIAGLDQTLPLLPQLDRLSDEQLRAAFRSMDPLAQ